MTVESSFCRMAMHLCMASVVLVSWDGTLIGQETAFELGRRENVIEMMEYRRNDEFGRSNNIIEHKDLSVLIIGAGTIGSAAAPPPTPTWL